MGAVERDGIIDGRHIAEGDVLIGLPSNGLHTNGYTLARKVLLSSREITDTVEELGTTLADELLKVHRTYNSVVRSAIAQHEVKGMAHITGGGLEGNTERILPDGLGIDIDWDAWEAPPIFRLIQKEGDVEESEMRRTFNMGIGFAVVASPEEADGISTTLSAHGEKPVTVGCVVGVS